MFRRKSDETVTFHVHALQTHKAAVITGKWLSKPLSVAVIGSFLDQVRASPVVNRANMPPCSQCVTYSVLRRCRRLAALLPFPMRT